MASPGPFAHQISTGLWGSFSWGVSPFRLRTHIVPILQTQKVLHKCVPNSVSRRQPSYPSSSARAGFTQRKWKGRQSWPALRPLPHEVGAGPGPPAALVHALDHRLRAVLHLAGHRPCHRVMAPVPVGRATATSVPPVPQASHCGSKGRPRPEGAPPHAGRATAAGQGAHWDPLPAQRERVATPLSHQGPPPAPSPTSFQSSNNSMWSQDGAVPLPGNPPLEGKTVGRWLEHTGTRGHRKNHRMSMGLWNCGNPAGSPTQVLRKGSGWELRDPSQRTLSVGAKSRDNPQKGQQSEQRQGAETDRPGFRDLPADRRLEEGEEPGGRKRPGTCQARSGSHPDVCGSHWKTLSCGQWLRWLWF